MKDIIVTGNVYEQLSWLQDHVGFYIETNQYGEILGDGWKILFIYDEYSILNDKQRVFIDDDNFATEFILRFV